MLRLTREVFKKPPLLKFDKEQQIPIKTYEYNFEFPDISKIDKSEMYKVYDDILNTFEQQLNEWIYG